jgi:hypothetical protein
MKNTMTYTKIANSKEYNDTSLSLGFRRWSCLPNKMRLNFNKAAFLKLGNLNIHSFSVDFFAAMTETEYCQYLQTH